MPRAKAAGRRALQLDPDLAEGHTWSGVVAFLYDWDPVAAETHLRRAIELRPDYSLAHSWYAVLLMARGRHDEAIARSRHAAELDPLAFTIQALVGQCLYFGRRYQEASERHRATLEMDPANLRALIWGARTYRITGQPEQGLRMIDQGIERHGRLPILLAERGMLLVKLGRPEEARTTLDELLELGQQHYVSAFHAAVIHLALSEDEELRRDFDRLVAERSGMLQFLGDPTWDGVREEAWCRELLTRAGVR
jgi:tetratricopeptide (TPR) repeat protein